MTERKVLPLIYNRRAAKILKFPVTTCYQVDASKPQLIECIMPVGHNRYVDLNTGKEVNALSIQIVADEAGKDDTDKLTGKAAETVNTDEVVSLYELDKQEEAKPRKKATKKAK